MTKPVENLTNIDSFAAAVPEASKLNSKQRAALALVARGLKFAEVARKVGVCRATVSGWAHHDPNFRRALSALQSSLYLIGPGDEAEAFKAVESKPLLSLPGIRARLELADMLILKDLQEHTTQRTRTIQRLESVLGTANEFLSKVNSSTAAHELIRQRTTEYRHLVLQAVVDVFSGVPDAEALLSKFRHRLLAIDEKSGIDE